MIRIVLVNMLLFSLPFILYGCYIYVTRGPQDKAEIWRQAPIHWLLFIGTFLVIGLMVSFVSFSDSNSKGTYHPPIFKDGKLQPGRVE